MPVSLSTSIVAKAQNASSSSYDRLRRLPAAVPSAHTCRPLAVGATARRSVPLVPSMISPGGVVMAAWSWRAVAFLRSAAGLLHGPLGDVEIERPDAYQLVLGVDPRAGDDGLAPVGAGDAALDGQQVFLPGACDLRRQPQRADARRQGLDPGPEQAGQRRCHGFQAGVVQHWLPFPQVVHEQVADRLGLQPVAADQFLDGQLALGHAERADGGRRVAGEDPEGAEPEVEVDFILAAADVDPPLGVGELDAVPDGDVAD